MSLYSTRVASGWCSLTQRLKDYFAVAFRRILSALFLLSLFVYCTRFTRQTSQNSAQKNLGTQSIPAASKPWQDQATGLFLGSLAATVALAGSVLPRPQKDGAANNKVEQALQDSEARFHAFINEGSFYAWITDSEGVVEYLNAPYCTMIGLSSTACAGLTVFDLYPAETAQVMLNNIRQVAQTGQTLETIETAPLPDGKLHHFLVHKFRLGTVNGRILVGGSAIDITEHRTMQQALQDNAERLREAQQVAHLGSWERDLITGTILWSEEMFRISGFDPAQGVPSLERIHLRIHPDDREKYRQIFETATRTKRRYQFDIRLLFEDGNVTWGHVIGKVEQDETGRDVRWFGTLMDITAQKRTEMALRKNKENLKHAQALAHVGSWERNYQEGTMLWSDELFRLCGLEPGAIAPSIEAHFSFIHPLDRQRTQECMNRCIAEGQGSEIEVRLVGADDLMRHVSIRTEILKNEAGQSIGSRGTVTDVTERVKALQEQTKFVSLIENSSDFIAMAALDGTLLTLNQAGRKLVGLERVEEVTTTLLPDFMPAHVWKEMRQNVLPLVMRDDRWEGECQLINVTTSTVYDMQASFFLIRNPASGEPMCLATVQRNITEQKWSDIQLQQSLVLVQEQNVQLEWQQQELAQANKRLETANEMLALLATTDGLTGVKNHRAFQEKLTEEFNRVERTYRPFSVILLDVARFKSYNDTYGHLEGDRILKHIAQTLQQTARQTDFVARYGGEEFIILLLETGVEGAMQAAERFQAALAAQDWLHGQITASFGVSTLNALTETPQKLVDWADKALYTSKQSGRNRVTHANSLQVNGEEKL